MIFTMFMLIGVLLDGTVVPMHTFPTRHMCEAAVQYIQDQSEKEAHVYCVKFKIEEV